MMSGNIKLLVAALVTGVMLTGCGSDDDSDSANSTKVSFDAKPLIDNVADNIIVATYTDLNAQATDLKAAIGAMNTGGITAAELDAAQAAWKATRAPWESSEGFLFGPVDAQGIDPAMDSWPLSQTDLDTFLAAGNTSPADVRNANDNVRGFHALEYLLFGDGVASNDQAETDIDADELAYLVSLATVLQENTQALEDGWNTQYDPNDSTSGPYVDQVKNPGADSVYASQGAVVEELINGILGIVDEVGNGKITEPFGASAADADTTLVESQYSWNSLTDFHNNIQSVLNVYTGVRGFDPASETVAAADNGLYSFVQTHDAALADRLYDEIVAAYDAIGLIDQDGDPATTDIANPATQMPFREAIGDNAARVSIQDAIDALATVQATLQDDVLPLVAETEFAE